MRGFEWTSDRFGHINVLFSKNNTNAKIDGGYVDMRTFWKWFTDNPNLGGGADGLGIFNHPGGKSLTDQDAAAFNWNDFKYVPAADHRMVGIEVYNDTDDFGTARGPGAGYYVHALDKGWHVGAIGAEDLHGDPGSRDDYGAPRWAKTVILSNDRSPSVAARGDARPPVLRGPSQRRTPARLHRRRQRHGFTFRNGRSPVDLHIVASSNRPEATVEVVTSSGTVVSSATGSVDVTIPSSSGQKYYFMRVHEGSEVIGYSSPDLGVECGRDTRRRGSPGTCTSTPATRTTPTAGRTTTTPDRRSSTRSAHRSTSDSSRRPPADSTTSRSPITTTSVPSPIPVSATHGVIGIPGYENSLSGHAQMLGASKVYAHGDGAAAINTMADELRADGGVFQINHPAEGLVDELGSDCADTSRLDWRYDFDVRPDTIEVWNISNLNQPPGPSATSNEDAITLWECWLNRGERVGATGGSDSHWLALSLAMGPGNPTTWVFAKDRDRGSILQALREGRTSVSLLPPIAGAVRLVLEADGDRDGIYESVVGDEVPPGTPMRVRGDGLTTTGQVDVRANGATVMNAVTLMPGKSLAFHAPEEDGWVRATLKISDGENPRRGFCNQFIGKQTTYCRNPLATIALTSPIYVE